jgi:concentrative nucleoside transporter, CNT family
VDIIRGLFGLIVLVGLAWLISENKKRVKWKTVGIGLLIQLTLAILILKVSQVEAIFEWVGEKFVEVINFARHGVDFLFASFITGELEVPLVNFAFTVLPIIIFFSALTSMLYYLGILQKLVYVFAWVMKRTMGISGAESMAAAGNIFLGQTESPLLVKPYLDKMTRSEMMALMTGGMATIAGSVLATYIMFLGDGDPVKEVLFAKHLLIASVMSAPAAIVAAKIIVPETQPFNEDFEIPKDKLGTNILEAISNGTTEGLKLAINVGAMLLVFIALIFMLNWLLSIAGQMPLSGDVRVLYNGNVIPHNLNSIILFGTDYNELSFQFILGHVLAPLAWVLGVDSRDIFLVGQLLGEKTVINEFVAYTSLDAMKEQGLFASEKSIIIATYVLCGFANFSSIGIQIGGIGSLAPNQRPLLSQLGMKSLIGGTIACLFTAVIVGMLL